MNPSQPAKDADANALDKLLLRQLRRLGLSQLDPPTDLSAWQAFLERVSHTYAEDQQERYLLERSLAISSREMQTLYDDLRRASVTEVTAERDKLRAIIDGFQDGFCRLDLDGGLVEANPSAATLLGQEPGLVQGPVLERFRLQDGSRPQALLDAISAGHSIRDEHAELAGAGDDDAALPVALLLYPIRQKGEITGCALVFRDISALLDAQLQRRRLELAVQASADAIYITDPDGVIQYVNPAFTEISGWPVEQAVGRTPSILRSAETPSSTHRDLWHQITAGHTWSGRLLNRRRTTDGSVQTYWAQTTIAPIRSDAERLLGYVAVQRDVSAAVAEERRREREAALSGLQAAIAEALRIGDTLDARLQAAAERMLGLPDVPLDGAWLIALRRQGEPQLLGEPGTELPNIDALLTQLAHPGSSGRPTTTDRPRPALLLPLSQRGTDDAGICWLGLLEPHRLDPALEGMLQLTAGMMSAAIADDDARREAEAARQAALDAADAKSRFLANMSHEIRTPMNGIIGMLDMLRDSSLDAEQQRFLSIAAGSAEGLMRIINDVLDFSKLEAGKVQLEQIPFDARLAVDETLALFGNRALEKGVVLSGRYAEDAPHLLVGDPLRLRQVLNNLVDNALKFTADGRVTLRVRELERDDAGTRLLFEVEDTGVGMDGDLIGRLFQPFTQADGSTTRRFGGTGLGLAISSQLTALMGGEIGADSRQGAGSTFWLALPFPRQGPQQQDESPGQLSGLRVLAVEASATHRDFLTRHLRHWGADFVVLDRADQTMETLAAAASGSRAFQVAILDMQMPGLDGLTLGRQIKANPLISATRLLMTTRDLGCEESLRAAGFRFVLTKPMSQQALRAALLHQADHRTTPIVNTSQGPRRGRILLAEDNPVNQQVALGLLSKLGVAVDLAPDGVEALRCAARNAYDLILMDCQMPRMDGYEATRQIRSRTAPGQRRVPIVALTANAMAGDRERCLDAGMDDYLAKPIRLKQLAGTLEKWLGRLDQAPTRR